MIIDAVVAVYNREVQRVPLVEVAERQLNLKIFICDNSTDCLIKERNREYTEKRQNLVWLDMGGNVGISAAFNRAVEMTKGDMVCFFDDDTEVPSDYFWKASRYMSNGGPGLYLPLVYSKGILLSPLIADGVVIRKARSVGELANRCVSGFNTGMFLDGNTARELKHDENLFLDFVDHAYCSLARDRGVEIKIAENIELEQDYSRDTNSLSDAIFRMGITEKDVKHYYSSSIFSRTYAGAYLLYLRLRNAVKYKTILFFFPSLFNRTDSGVDADSNEKGNSGKNRFTRDAN